MDATPLNRALSAAILRLLRPLVRILLRNGVPFGAFAELARWVYADVAAREFAVAERKSSDARVSVITGLTRKEVARLRRLETPDDRAAAQQYHRAARVIGGWLRDARFTAADGTPLPLSMEPPGKTQDDTPAFPELVRAYSGDMTARAVLDELLRVGAVERDVQGRVRLRAAGYVPQGSDIAKLHILGHDVGLLIHTIDHNLHCADQPPRFQRKVAYDNLPQESLPQLRLLAAESAQALLREFDLYLAQQDRDLYPDVRGTGRVRAGIGIYYFEEEVAAEE